MRQRDPIAVDQRVSLRSTACGVPRRVRFTIGGAMQHGGRHGRQEGLDRKDHGPTHVDARRQPFQCPKRGAHQQHQADVSERHLLESGV